MESELSHHDKPKDVKRSKEVKHSKLHKYMVLQPENKDTHVSSTTPSGAAKKVYSKCIRPYLNKAEEKKTHIVKIQNEAGKVFEYKVTEIEKNDIVTRGQKQIPYTYNVHVQSLNIHRTDRSRRKHKSDSHSPVQKHDNFVWFTKPKPKQRRDEVDETIAL